MAAPKREPTVKPKGKPRGKPFTGRDDPRVNLAGAPKRGQSWAELIRDLTELDGPQAAARAGFLAAQFKRLQPGVTLKELVVLRVIASLIDEPQPGLFNALMDRAEGKVTLPLEHTQRETVFDYGRVIARIAAGPEGDSETPGEDQGGLMRPALRENHDGGDDGSGVG